ncbi:unnamed protein product [Camellia sinensis]
MELSLLPYHHHKPAFLPHSLSSIFISRKRPFNRNTSVLSCRCSSSSSPEATAKAPTLSSQCQGRRALMACLLSAAAGISVCDVAGAVSTSRRALRGEKIPESDFKTLPNGLKLVFTQILMALSFRYYDLKVGGGAEAVKGSRVAPYGFDVGQSERGTVLKGLDLGVQGMKVGGQRVLIVPPELAYGSKGVQEIPPNATIELNVELLAIKQSPFGYVIRVLRSTFINLLLKFYSSSQKTCPNCGSIQVPYPLSTNPNCGDPDYSIRCDPLSHKLFFDGLNGSSYLILRIMEAFQRIVVQPAPWLPGTCVTQDMPVSEGLWLNQTLPFNITSSNTIFLFSCSPRLLISPLNCTSSSLCHLYLESSGHVDKKRALQCASSLDPCCTFLAGGTPSAYKIRLHSSGCRGFRSILHLDPEKPPNQWEEGLEIQWAPPPEPACKTQLDCSGASKCSPTGENNVFRCLCNSGYYWNHSLSTCSRQKKKNRKSDLTSKVSIGVVSFFTLAVVMAAITVRKSRKVSNQAKLAKAREDALKSSNGGKSARMFSLKEMKKATNGFSKDRILGSGGFGEVYKGELQDGTVVAVKSAKVGDIKSTHQVLNEVGILSQVNHRNLVRLMGCCVEAEQPLLIYEYISNGTLHDHLHRKCTFLDWKTRLRISLQTAEALAYLHSAAYTPIYHRDVKSSNILLDDDFNAKVADFGLSRLARPGLSHLSTCAQGTLGYLDPEYYRNYQLTEKSDVYSYGVVLLELLTSQKAIDFTRDQDDVNLAVYVSQRAHGDSIMEVVDQQCLGEEPHVKIVTSVKFFAELALACLREKKEDRPSMKDVVQELQYVSEILAQEEASNEMSVETI